MKSVIKHIIITALAFLVVSFFAVLTLNVSFLSPIARVMEDFSMTDIFYQVQRDGGECDTSRAVTIVDMTELYSRRDLAQNLEVVASLQPKTIGVDVVFEGLKEDSVGDDMIGRIALLHQNMVFSYKLFNYENDSIGYTDDVHSFFADEMPIHEGFTNMPRNLYGGMKRELSLGRTVRGELKPSLILEVTNRYAGRDVVPLEDRDVQVNFTPLHFPVVSPDSLLAYQDSIRDHVVLFGAMKDENDMHYTPLGKMAGVELLAYSIETLLRQKEVSVVSGWAYWLITVLIVFLSSVLLSHYKQFFEKRRNQFLRFLMTTSFMTGLFLFIWMALLTGIAFVIFSLFHVSFNLGWAFASIAFLSSSAAFCDVCIKTIIKPLKQ